MPAAYVSSRLGEGVSVAAGSLLLCTAGRMTLFPLASLSTPCDSSGMTIEKIEITEGVAREVYLAANEVLGAQTRARSSG